MLMVLLMLVVLVMLTMQPVESWPFKLQPVVAGWPSWRSSVVKLPHIMIIKPSLLTFVDICTWNSLISWWLNHHRWLYVMIWHNIMTFSKFTRTDSNGQQLPSFPNFQARFIGGFLLHWNWNWKLGDQKDFRRRQTMVHTFFFSKRTERKTLKWEAGTVLLKSNRDIKCWTGF